jgi:serine/threonine-protein kinase
VILYLLTTGRHPFQGSDSATTLRNIVGGEPAVRPSTLKPNYSRTLEAVVMKALEKDRDRRWPSAEEMRLALQRGVPQAFDLGSEAQLRTFMADTVGDRAARKRETIRHAEIVVDAGAGEPSGGTSSSSVTSLRAIAVDTAAERASLVAPAPTPPARFSSIMPTLRPLLARSVPPRRLRRPLLIAGVVAAALVVGSLWLRSPSSVPSVATAPAADMVDLSPPRAAPSASPVEAPRATVAPSASAAPNASAATVASGKRARAAH